MTDVQNTENDASEAGRLRRQMKALLRRWAAREAVFMAMPADELADLGPAPSAHESAAAATLMCANDLANVLACGNPHCADCSPEVEKGAGDAPGR